MSSNKMALDALTAIQDAIGMPTSGDSSDFVWPKSTMRHPGETAYGWICEKHGLGYQSGCICCAGDLKAYREQKDREARYAREDAIRDASKKVRAAIAALQAEPPQPNMPYLPEFSAHIANQCHQMAGLPDMPDKLTWTQLHKFAEVVWNKCADVHCRAFASGGLQAEPQGWMPFDYANPPDDGLMFVAASAPETDCDVDDYGKTVGWHTGEIERTVCMVLFSAGTDRDHDFQPVAEYDAGKVPAEGWVTHYMRVQLPALPATPPKD